MNPISEEECKLICERICKYHPYDNTKLRKLILKLTYPFWKPLFNHIFWELYNKGVIDSSRVHLACSLTDRTQKNSQKIW